MTNNIGSDAYAQYEDFDSYSYKSKSIQYLMEDDQVIWKLLAYNSSDVLE